MYIVKQRNEKSLVYPTKIIELKRLKALSSDLAIRILVELSKEPQCAMDLARKLKIHEQKVYYHIKKLEEAKFISLIGKEERVGATAKIYYASSPSFSFLLNGKKISVERKIKIEENLFLKSFLENNFSNSLIVVGSPDPHGKYGVPALDGAAAIDLALFLGTFLKESKTCYKLDTEINEKDLRKNLILVGGPKANILIEKINPKLPIRFDPKNDFNIVSTLTGNIYSQDEAGILIKMKSPFNEKREILVLSGKRFKGTRAAILALIKFLPKITKIKEGTVARVVLGIDKDSDGIVDSVEFLE